MAVEIIKGEEELIPESRVFAAENLPYPIPGLDDRRFERLVYWLYKNEISNGIWKDTFDEIRLMTGVRDGGKDCVLLKNNIQDGVIQCKFSEKDKALELPVFAKELIKFGLYSLVETQAIRLYEGYQYFIAVSGQFHAKTLEVIDNYPTGIIEHKDFEKWTNEIIKKNASLRHFRFEFVQAQLRTNLAKMKILKIDGDELQMRLEAGNQGNVRKAFFTVKSLVENEALEPLAEKLNAIEGQLHTVDDTTRKIYEVVHPLPIRNIFAKNDDYLNRSVTGEDDQFAFAFFDQKTTLSEVIKTHRKVTLLGSGLIGKTTELKQLAYHLAKDKEEYFVYFIALDVYSNEAITSHIKGIDRIPPGKLIVLLDGLDQIPEEFETMAKTKIKAFVRDHPDCLMVVSSRTNFYYTDDDDNGLNTLPFFESFTLKKLAPEDVDKLVTKWLGSDKEDFMKCIRKYDLDDLLTIPFYFNRFAQQYKKNNSIAESRAALFEEIIQDGIKADINRLQVPNAPQREQEIYDALKKVALIMQMMGNYFFTRKDVQQILANEQLEGLFRNIASLLNGSDHIDGSWSFLHSNFQEYLAARELAGLSFEAIKRTVSIKPAHDIMKPTWLGTISFLFSLLPVPDPLRGKLVQWLEKDNAEQLIMIDPGTLDAGFRLQIFKRIYEEHKKKEIPFHHSKYNLENVAHFVESTLSINYFVAEFDILTIESAKQNLLKLALNIDIAAYPTSKLLFKRAILDQIEGIDDYTRQLAINVNSTLFKMGLEEFDKIFQAYKGSSDSGVRSALYLSMFKQGYQEHYLEFIMDQLELITREEAPTPGQKHKTSKRFFDEKLWIERCLLSVKSETAIVVYLDWMLKFAHRKFFPSQLKESFPKLLKLALEFGNPLIDNKIKDIYLLTGPYYVHERSEFIEYFKAKGCQLDIVKAVYAMQTPPRFTELQIIATLADEKSIDFLMEQFKGGSLQLKDMELFQDLFKDEHLELKIYFNMQMNTVQHFPFRVPPDHARKEFARDSQLINIYFDKQLFLAEVGKPMKKLGRKVCFYNDLQSIRTQNHTTHFCFDFAFEALRQEDDYYQIELDKVIQEIEADWPLVSMRWIYDFYKRHPKWSFSDGQLATIKTWCDGQARVVDFYTASTRRDPRTDVPAEMLLAFFTRKLLLTSYGDQFYLDLLYYPEWEESAAQLEFIEERCRREQIIDQVAINLTERKLNGSILERHLKYIVLHEVKDLAKAIFEYLKNEETYNWHELLEAYVALDGDMKRLWELLPLLPTSYYHDAVVEQLLKSESQKVKDYLLSIFKGLEEKRKLEIARILIRLQSRTGFRFYYEYIRQKKHVPDYTSPNNPLYQVHAIYLADIALKLYVLSYNPSIIYEMIDNHHHIASSVLYNIYLAPGNYRKMRIVLAFFIGYLRLRQLFQPAQTRRTMIRDLSYYLQGISHQHDVNQSNQLKIVEALQQYGRLFRTTG
jgi:hypothetical protein